MALGLSVPYLSDGHDDVISLGEGQGAKAPGCGIGCAFPVFPGYSLQPTPGSSGEERWCCVSEGRRAAILQGTLPRSCSLVPAEGDSQVGVALGSGDLNMLLLIF